ncbi:MAG TPA: MFS transporter [Croceibacterium sp.]|jgi:MFS family permease
MRQAEPQSRTKLPSTVWALGLVSLLMDASSESIHGLLPLFLTVTLGASAATVGLIDGVGEAVASITKMFSGAWSDRMGRRKPLVLLGYGLAAVSKPLFPLAGSAGVVFAARIADRFGKGVRGAPRDAMIADVTPPALRGRAFGLRQALDTVGAIIGPLAAVALMAAFADDMRLVFWIAAIPAVAAALVVWVAVKEDLGSAPSRAERPPIRLGDLRRLPADFWQVIAIATVFTLARFSEAFLVLKAHAVGLPLALAPLVLVAMSVVYAAGSYPAGAWADRASARLLLVAGLVCLIAADLTLAAAASVAAAFAGIALWGAHMALSQGLMGKLVADHAPRELRGSSFGVFHLTTGLATLVASVTAGLLWDKIGPGATFFAGATFAALALLMALRVR